MRRYLPKREPFDRVERDEFPKVEHQINTRYRNKLDSENTADSLA